MKRRTRRRQMNGTSPWLARFVPPITYVQPAKKKVLQTKETKETTDVQFESMVRSGAEWLRREYSWMDDIEPPVVAKYLAQKMKQDTGAGDPIDETVSVLAEIYAEKLTASVLQNGDIKNVGIPDNVLKGVVFFSLKRALRDNTVPKTAVEEGVMLAARIYGENLAVQYAVANGIGEQPMKDYFRVAFNPPYRDLLRNGIGNIVNTVIVEGRREGFI